jgi:arylformamidase
LHQLFVYINRELGERHWSSAAICNIMRVMKSWIDITVPLRHAMIHWPDNPLVNIERVRDLDRGDSHTISQISMGSHTGTHMDAPAHFICKGIGIDKMPLDATVGRARVIEIQDTESIKPEELSGHHIRRGERILFKTRNSSIVW